MSAIYPGYTYILFRELKDIIISRALDLLGLYTAKDLDQYSHNKKIQVELARDESIGRAFVQTCGAVTV